MTWLVTIALTLLAFFGCERPATPRDLEQSFLERASSRGMLDVRLADTALSRGVHPAVREFARRVLADWAGQRQDLVNAALADELTLPRDLTEAEQTEYIHVAASRGEAFDQAYLAATIAAQREAIADCHEETRNFHSAVASWAAGALPEFERRLAAARLLADETPSAVRISAATPE